MANAPGQHVGAKMRGVHVPMAASGVLRVVCAAPCCCREPQCCSGAGDGREAAGISSGVNRRHWGIVLWAISAFHTVPFSKVSTAQPTPKELQWGGGRNRAFPLVTGVGRGEEPLALLPSSDAFILFPRLLQLYSTY